MTADDLERLDADDLGEYTPAVYARSVAEADQYAQLLLDHDIPHLVDEDYEPEEPEESPAVKGGVPVLVPESLLDEAQDIIAEFDEMAPYTDEDDQPAGGDYQDEDDYSPLDVGGEDALLVEDEEEEDGDVDVGDDLDDEDDEAY